MSREQDLATALDSIGALTREFAASGRRPFADRALRRAHYDILFALSRTPDGTSVGGLASHLKVTSGAVSQVLELLRTAGLVTAHPDVLDTRRRIIRLTDAAQDEIDAFQHRFIADLAPRFSALADDEVAQLAALLGRLDFAGETLLQPDRAGTTKAAP